MKKNKKTNFPKMHTYCKGEMSPEEFTKKILAEGEPNDCIGIALSSEKDLAEIMKAMGMVSTDEGSLGRTGIGVYKRGKADECEGCDKCEEKSVPKSKITIEFDGTGESTSYSLGVKLNGSPEIAETVMTEALCAFINRMHPGVDLRTLIERVSVVIELTKATADPDDDEDDDTDSILN